MIRENATGRRYREVKSTSYCKERTEYASLRKSGARDLELHKHTHSHTHVPETEILLEPQLTEECRREKTGSPPLPSCAGGGKERRRGYKTRWEGDAHRLFPVRAIFPSFSSILSPPARRLASHFFFFFLLPPTTPCFHPRFPPPYARQGNRE